jgi:hypothetical protein
MIELGDKTFSDITDSGILGLFVEVSFENDERINMTKETITRMGIVNHVKKILNQTVHLLHYNSRYFIVHFKEMYYFDDFRVPKLKAEDILRRNLIADYLQQWDLLKILNPEEIKEYHTTELELNLKDEKNCRLFVLSKKEMFTEKWELRQIHTIDFDTLSG